MKLANIQSKQPFYVTKDGLVFNNNYELVEGNYHKVHKLHILTYRDLENKERQIPFTKLIYTSFFPEREIKGRTVVRKDRKRRINVQPI